jgi:hypothetical protein
MVSTDIDINLQQTAISIFCIFLWTRKIVCCEINQRIDITLNKVRKIFFLPFR